MQLIALIIAFTINALDIIFSMFKTFFNAILISVMVLVHCDNSKIVFNDRVFRYVGNLSSQEPIEDTIEDTNDLQENLKTDSKSEEIPESILIQLKDIKDASDFIASFLTPNANTNTNANRKDVFLQYLQRGTSENPSTDEISVTEERRKLSKMPKISKPALCDIEMKIIELQPLGLKNEIYFPSCVRIPRCSGCCHSQRLQCSPISKSFEDITVIRVKYSTAENRLKFEGFKVFRIEKHDNCSCDCIQKASDCRPAQYYLKSECRCVCPNLIEANECQMDQNKYWDYDECKCKCKSVPLCSTGLSFNDMKCRCEIEQQINSSANITNGDQQNNSRSVYNYFLSLSENTEIQVQRTKGLDVFNKKGINPETDEDYRENI